MVVLTLLSSHGFFALSHQATFSTIPWQAAFIGVPGNFAFQSVPAALVGAHLFASYIITVAALPLSLTYFGIAVQSRNALAHRSYMLLMFSALSVRFFFSFLYLLSRSHALKRSKSLCMV